MVSALVAEARLVFGACFLLARGSSPPFSCISAQAGSESTLHRWIRTLLEHGSPFLGSAWHWSVAQCQLFHAQLSLVVAPATRTAEPVAATPFLPDQFAWSSPPVPFPAAICAFQVFHSLRVGAPWAHALDLFAGLPDRHLSADGRVFATPALRGPGGAPDRRVVLSEPDAADALYL